MIVQAAEPTAEELAADPSLTGGEGIDLGVTPELKIPTTLEEAQRELVKINERYASSSRAGKENHALAEERAQKLETLNQEIAELRAKLPPPAADNPRSAAIQLPSLDQMIQVKMDKGGMTEPQARHQAEAEMSILQQLNETRVASRALANQIKLMNMEQGRMAVATNPNLKEAREFFNNKDFPTMAGASDSEVLQQYQVIKPRLAPAVSSRDLSAVKRAAGAAAGGAGAGAGPSANAEADEFAKSNGFNNAAQMHALEACKTDADFAAYRKQFPKKS